MLKKAKKETRAERIDRQRHEKQLRKRTKHTKGHLKYLHSIAADPSSVDKEIRRHERHIAKLREQIALHEAAITKIRDDVEHVHERIEVAQGTLRSIESELNQNLIEKLKQEYLNINKMLKEERDACSST